MTQHLEKHDGTNLKASNASMRNLDKNVHSYNDYDGSRKYPAH